jgi:hypothetical protein
VRLELGQFGHDDTLLAGIGHHAAMDVWYAAYGSNLSAERFACYVSGGVAPGSTGRNPGCRDTTPPRDDRPVELPYRLYFAGDSRTWGGGVAFVDGNVPDRTLGRAWLLSEEQFDDVVAQENGLRPGSGITSGWYRSVLPCGTIDGLPVLTITSAARRPANPPSDAYLAHLAVGLQQAHDLGPAAIAEYLAPRAAVAHERVLALVEG